MANCLQIMFTIVKAIDVPKDDLLETFSYHSIIITKFM
jgi:hypothetical protein